MTHDPNSPKKSPKRRPVTRFGQISQSQLKFGSEERFAWQKSQNSSDVVYKLPDMTMTKSVIFGSSLRQGMDDNPDNKKRSTGPGSYDFASCYDHNSEYSTKQGNRFSCAARQSMAVKTPSQGAIYNIEKCYWNGPEKQQPIGFPVSSRTALNSGSCTADADMFMPKYDTGTAITIASRLKTKPPSSNTPGAIYDVQKYFDFRTGPSFSFGKGRGNRFKEVGFLPELPDL